MGKRERKAGVRRSPFPGQAPTSSQTEPVLGPRHQQEKLGPHGRTLDTTKSSQACVRRPLPSGDLQLTGRAVSLGA